LGASNLYFSKLHMRRQTTAQPTWCSLDDKFYLSWQGAAELTCCSWADSWVDKLQLSWQTTAQPTWCSWDDKFHLSWQGAAELTNCSWADSWVDKLHLSWQTSAQPTWCSWDANFYLSWQGAAELTSCSWADKLQLSWQRKWQVATEPSDSSWAELTHRSWAAILQLSWQTEPLDCCQADISWPSRQIAAEMTDCKEAYALQLSWCFATGLSQQMNCMAAYARADIVHLSWQNSSELTDCSWTDILQGRKTREVTLCSRADWVQPSQLIAAGLKGVHLSWQLQFTGKVAAELTNCS